MRALQVAFIGGPMYDRLYRELGRFTKRTGISVDVAMHLPHHELNEAVRANYASSEPTVRLDLISCHCKYAPSQRHYLVPLDDFLAAEEVSQYVSSMVEFARIDGRLYQLPRNCDVRVLIYREDALLEPSAWSSAGPEGPLDVPSTWDELVEIAEQLVDVGRGRSGFAFTGKYSGLFGSFYELLASAGGTLLNADGSSAFNSAEGEWTLGTLKRLYLHAACSEIADYSYDEVSTSFAAGRCAMYMDWPAYWKFINDPATSQSSGHVGVAAYPRGPAGISKVYTGCHSFAIPTSTRDLPAALELLRFLTSDETLLVEARQGSLVPKHAVLRVMKSQCEDEPLEARRWEILRETMEKHALLPPKLAQWPAIEDALWSLLRCGITGEIGVPEALSAAASRIDEVAKVDEGP